MTSRDDRCAMRGCGKRRDHAWHDLRRLQMRGHAFVEPAPAPLAEPVLNENGVPELGVTGFGEACERCAALGYARCTHAAPEPTCAKPGCGGSQPLCDQLQAAYAAGRDEALREAEEKARTGVDLASPCLAIADAIRALRAAK